MGRRAAGAVSLAGIATVGQILALALPESRVGINLVTLGLLDTLCLIFCVLAARRGNDRWAWLLIGVSRLLSLFANAALGQATITGNAGWWWAGAISGIAMYGTLSVGAMAFPAQNLRGRQRVALAGEATAVLGCGFMYVWYFVLKPHLEQNTTGAQELVSVGFPIGDLLLLIAISVLVLRGGVQRSSRPVALLLAGMTAYLLSDGAFNAIGDDGNHASGPALAVLATVIASAAMAIAAYWQSTGTVHGEGVPESDPATTGWFAYFPYAAVFLGYALMVAITIRDDELLSWGGQVFGLIVMTGGVAVRQLVSLRESREFEVTDALTGLANRRGLRRALERELRRDRLVAVLAVDLDGFKGINDSYGHSAGDVVLLEFARTLEAATRGTDVAARVGGDEFVVLLTGLEQPSDATAVAQRIQAAALNNPVRFGADVIVNRSSIGVATSIAEDSADDLLKHADIAMYQAKRSGTHGVAVYDPSMVDRRGDDTVLGNDLESAVASGQLRVLYQPMIDLGTGLPCGVEALVRWNHPTRGLVSPLDFIPIAERTGAITGIGRYVLEQACRTVRAWQEHLPEDRSIYASVNLSPRQLQDSTLVSEVLAVLDRTGLAPHDLVLEVTENAIIDERVAIPALDRLRNAGVRIAVDDFGTGYSSLHYLARLPVDILKIDRSFIAELDGTSQGSAITEAVIRLGQVLQLTTVAEGIETERQAAELIGLGCQTGQGYLYAKPLPVEEAAAFLLTGSAERVGVVPAGEHGTGGQTGDLRG